ncbi:XRE family transcriptional regulator [Wolbachia endosymbiont of Drosophila bocki]|nr:MULTISPECIES: XRE family transcriptional regulator [unclassified Wolbachia]MDE5057726.1 XRE family transcriptional regulator [Wolbachia endosymbiont of Drosophila bocki]MDE5066624.1 XRE family transcriptional regulator [Wolbachia endosymbiont of Drosophila leontia]
MSFPSFLSYYEDFKQVLKIDQPKVSQINRSKIEGFSLEYLLNLLIVLGQDINVRIKHNSKPA